MQEARSQLAPFDIHGVILRLEGPPEVLSDVARDLAWFASPGAAGRGIRIRATLAQVPKGAIPPARARLQLPEAAVFDAGGIRYVDYQGQALAVMDFAREQAELIGPDPERLRELVYLLALSRVGEHLDRRGIHRLHALGVRLGGKTLAVLMPEGGGKTTLALALLAHTPATLLSEDTPLATRGGRLLPFPLRLAAREGTDLPFPPRHLRVFRRARHGAKRVVDLEAVADRVAPAAPVDALLLGLRSSATEPEITALSRVRAFPAVAANLVFGLGLPQVVEFFLRGSAADALGKGGIVASRLLTASALLARARVARFALCPDARLNALALAGWIR